MYAVDKSVWFKWEFLYEWSMTSVVCRGGKQKYCQELKKGQPNEVVK